MTYTYAQTAPNDIGNCRLIVFSINRKDYVLFAVDSIFNIEDWFMLDIAELFAALDRLRFRSRSRLSGKEVEYLKRKGMATILEHARSFVTRRLAEVNPANDGQQTLMKNHPVIIAQHATGMCCRKCLEKWHYTPKGEPLTENHINYIIEVLKRWLTEQNV